MECEYCKKSFTTKTSLNSHQKNTKYCLKIQGKSENDKYKCAGCYKCFPRLYEYNRHINICDSNSIVNEYKISLRELENKVSSYEYKMIFYETEIIKKDNLIKELQNKLENLAIHAISNSSNFEDQATIEIEEDIHTTEEDIHTIEEEYKLLPLDVGEGYVIENREEDGYINVTNLCKAGGKQFKHWKSIEKTKAFLKVLSSSVGIPTDEIIKYNTGSNAERATWVHPQVAINIAQWISPQFDVKVSAWIYEVMMTGKIDITNTKSYRQLQKENKDHQLKIQFLTKKYVKKQPRIQYDANNVIYILTTNRLKKDNVYILGKASNLTSRLSTYNKSDEHEVVFYKECPDENTMGIVENMVFSRLEKYREQANRERFILPEKEKIELFSNVINQSIEFFKI